MKSSVRIFTGCLVCLLLSTATVGQTEVERRQKTTDTNDAIIRGRVSLPSGFTLDGYARITLRTDQSILSTIYTNSSGEFQLRNLSQGIYFVEAEIAKSNFEPAVQRVELGRGLMVTLNLELREKKDPSLNRYGKVVSAAELKQTIPSAAKKQYEQGLKFVNKGNFQQAANHFQEALKIYPEYLAARNDLGAQYLKLKQIDEAQKHFELVLANDPKNFNAKFNMGLVQVERHNYRDAIGLLNQAVALDSTRPVARLWIGIAKLELGELDVAEQELTRSLIMGGAECIAAHYHLARIYFNRGAIQDAKRSVQVYIHEAPKGEFIKEAKELEKKISQR